MLFSVLILTFLWAIQVIFLNSYYKDYKKNDLKKAATEIKGYSSLTTSDLESVATKRDVCIEVYGAGSSYISNTFNQGCMEFGNRNFKVKQDFISSGALEKQYSLINERFKNETLIYALKLDDSTYAFINASLEPLNSTIKILSSQFIYTSILVLVLSLIIGYFISRRISKPIIKISDQAKKMANGNFDVHFDTKADIYEIDELASSLNYTKEELSKMSQLKRDLMANVSHDLKTPLTMIKAYAEMTSYITYDDKEKTFENLNIIIDETDRLNLLVNDILDLSALESGMEDKLEKVDLVSLTNNIIERFKILSEKENYVFEFNHPEDAYVYAPGKRIYQVIYNLVNNAINYTGDDKKVTINITSLEKTFLIEVIDTGCGIKEEDLNHIWDRYYHSDKKHKRNNYGTGLGLSIVKNILVNHNCKYGVKSSSKGSTFYFEIDKI